MAFDPGTSVQGRKHCLPHGSLVAGNGIANDTEDEDVYLVFHFFGRGCRAVFGRVLTLLQILGHCFEERWSCVAFAPWTSAQGKKPCLPPRFLVAGYGTANDPGDEGLYWVFYVLGRGCRAFFWTSADSSSNFRALL